MPSRSQTFKFSEALPDRLVLVSNGLGKWRHLVWAALGSRWSLSALAAGLIVGMVLVFHAVVTQAVQQSALRQQALAAQSQATWRCKLLSSVSARQACLQKIAPLATGGI